MPRFAKRLVYERELIHIIESESNFFGQRGTHSLGCDVLFLRSSGLDCYMHCFWGEVKTSKHHKMSFSVKLLEQYNEYLKLWKERHIITYYFYRLITQKQYYDYKPERNRLEVKKFREGHKEDKWRVLKVDQLPLNRNGRPYLDFFYEKAMTIPEFLELFP